MEKRKHIEVVAAIIRDDKGRIFATQRGYGAMKDGWEFPGGKIEPGETPEQALKREISEELDTEIEVGQLLHIVEWDYPEFHLTMHCYWCRVKSGKLTLKEHEAAKWLSIDKLDTVNWLPADQEVVNEVLRVKY
ncbi:MAG: 8-oxo-dGTP diphosphatase MutT [Muribaculaceae bacterium]|nr:8-oxo-dGTP diphosphatase MutT [Muribaculaceae bacterium]